MKTILSITLLLGSIYSTHGLELIKRDSPAVLEAPIERHRLSEDSPQSLLQRDTLRREVLYRRQNGGTVEASLGNIIGAYVIELQLGTPQQTVRVHIDTGSSDLWVNTPSSPICTRYSRYCESLGTYTPASSSTYSLVNNLFKVKYQDGTTARGIYASDTVSVGNATLPQLEFGVARQSTSTAAILGIGYRINEGASAYGAAATYPNLPAELAARGIINSNAYSLWLNDLSAYKGSILFGGVNTAKYQGTLRTLPILPSGGRYSQFFITLTSIGLDGNTDYFVKNSALPVLLDSGTTLTYFPTNIANAILNHFGAQYDSRRGLSLVSCGLGASSGTLDYTFSGVTIRVPLSEIVIRSGTSSATCVFGVAPAQGDFAVLGDTFLRSAYVVYDLSNNEISIAQTRFGSDIPDNTLEIAAGPSGVPGAKPVNNAVTKVRTTAKVESTGVSGNSGGSGGSGGGGGGSGNAAAALVAVSAAAWALLSVGIGSVVGLWIL